MNPVAEIQRFILRALKAANGEPLPQTILERACHDGFRPSPLLSDVHEAMRGLETGGFILGNRDDLDASEVLWGMTAKGVLKAKQL